MLRSFGLRPATVLLAIVLGLLTVSAARADGEAGLVVQDGDQVRTYCIAFEGEGITGAEMLKQAGLAAGAYGSGSALAVCSIGSRGCSDASSFSSCFCQCQGGNCTYWAFFTRQYGKGWVYSSLAYNLLSAKDGDIHGWKWGQGGPNSAPAPQDISFDQVCGHAPRGGASQPTAPPATSAPPTQPATIVTLPAGTSTTAASPTEGTAAASASPSTPLPTVIVTITGTTDPSPSASPTTPAAFEIAPEGDVGGGNDGLIAFGAVAAVLVAGIGAAAVWRARHGT